MKGKEALSCCWRQEEEPFFLPLLFSFLSSYSEEPCRRGTHRETVRCSRPHTWHVDPRPRPPPPPVQSTFYNANHCLLRGSLFSSLNNIWTHQLWVCFSTHTLVALSSFCFHMIQKRSWHLSTGLVANLPHPLPYCFGLFQTSSLISLRQGHAEGHSPLLVVRVAVAVVLGVCAVAFNATGAFLDPGPGASPVVVLLVGFANPPGVRTSIWRNRQGTLSWG